MEQCTTYAERGDEHDSKVRCGHAVLVLVIRNVFQVSKKRLEKALVVDWELVGDIADGLYQSWSHAWDVEVCVLLECIGNLIAVLLANISGYDGFWYFLKRKTNILVRVRL